MKPIRLSTVLCIFSMPSAFSQPTSIKVTNSSFEDNFKQTQGIQCPTKNTYPQALIGAWWSSYNGNKANNSGFRIIPAAKLTNVTGIKAFNLGHPFQNWSLHQTLETKYQKNQDYVLSVDVALKKIKGDSQAFTLRFYTKSGRLISESPVLKSTSADFTTFSFTCSAAKISATQAAGTPIQIAIVKTKDEAPDSIFLDNVRLRLSKAKTPSTTPSEKKPVTQVKPEVEVPDKQHAAITPDHKNDRAWWENRHTSKLAAAQKAKCDVLFIGDSITHGWETNGQPEWKKYFGNLKPFNLGFSGDRTEHVLWRIDNGEMDNLKPKVAVVMIGTNNTGYRSHQRNWSAQNEAEGIKAVIDRIHSKSPKTKVLLLAIFPRGLKADNRLRVNNNKINAIISKFHDGDKIHYLDITSVFLKKDGTLDKELMPDLLHPRKKGYDVWGKTMSIPLKNLLKSDKDAARKN